MDIFEKGKKVETPKAEERPETSNLAETGGKDNEEVVRELRVRPIREFFGLPDDSQDEKLDYVVKFFSKDGKEPERVIENLHKAEMNLSKGPFETKLQRIYRYVRLMTIVKNEMATL